MDLLNSEDNMKSTENRNDHSQEHNIPKTSRFPKKVFVSRNSLLTDLVAAGQLNLLLNLCTSFYVLLLFTTVIYYLATPGKFWRDLERILGACNFRQFLAMWLSFNVYAFLVFQGFKLWIAVRTKINTKFADNAALILFVIVMVFIFIATPYAIQQESPCPITGLAIMLEQVRISMKIYAFIRESAPRILKYKPTKDGDQQVSFFPSTKHFLCFLFFPTIIYRDTYPRKPKIDWRYAGKMLLLLISIIILTYCVHIRFVIDTFHNSGRQPFSPTKAAVILMGVPLYGGLMAFLTFYFLLHAFMNLGAELTRFADREFYQDWWNSTSFDEYFRKWNAVIYDWLYTYIYIDSNKIGFSRNQSLMLVFFTSAVAHEYVLTFTFGFFFPALLINFFLSLVMVLLSRGRKSQFWNTFMLGTWCLGCGIHMCLYSIEWYARMNCERQDDSFLDFFYPRVFDKSCRIFSFN